MTKAKGKPSLVLLHGLGGSSADWAGAAKILSKNYGVLVLDLPGAGSAPKPASGYDPVSLARYVENEMEEAGFGRAYVAGHSLGARVAGELAAREPSRVVKLALVSPIGAVAYGFTDRLKWKGMSRRAILSSVPESSIRNASGYGFGIDGPGKKGFVERTVASRKGPEGDAIARAVEMSVDGVLEAPPLVERLRGTKAPLLVVAGALDPLSPPADSRQLLKARPDATFVELPRLGHYPMLEDPKKLAETLKNFFG